MYCCHAWHETLQHDLPCFVSVFFSFSLVCRRGGEESCAA